MACKELTTPTELAVNLSEAKGHLRVTSSSEDTLIELYIRGATQMVEERSRRAFIQRQYLLTLDDFPDGDYIDLPASPLVSVDSLKYVNADTVLTTWDPSNYLVDTNSIIGRLSYVLGQVWPIPKPDTINSVQVTFTAGYGTDETSTPPMAKAAILYLTAQLFENRIPVDLMTGRVLDVPFALAYAIDTFKIVSV